jgi:hypothetical protein
MVGEAVTQVTQESGRPSLPLVTARRSHADPSAEALARALGNLSKLGAVALYERDLDAAQASWEEAV